MGDGAVFVDPQDLAAQVLQVLRGALRIGQPRPVVTVQLVALDKRVDALLTQLPLGLHL